jgi:spermidine synthase
MRMLVAVLVSLLSGAIGLCYELLWYRVLSYASGGTPSSFGLLLGFYLAGLAAGGYLVAWTSRAPAKKAYADYLGSIGLLALLANLTGYAVIPTAAWMAEGGAWWSVFPLIALSTSLLGVVLPLVSSYAVRADNLAGLRLAFVYFGNIVGAAGGSFVTGYLLMDVLPIDSIALAVAWLGLALTAGVILLSDMPRRQVAVWLGTLTGLAVLVAIINPALFDRLYERLLYKENAPAAGRFVRTVETRAGVVSVTAKGHVFGGGVYDGTANTDLGHDANNIYRAYALAALHRDPRDVLIIGIASGGWSQVVSHLPGVERVTILEINPGYLRLIPSLPAVASLMSNPKVSVVIDDGRRWLRRNPDRQFDLIVSNTTFHWRAHATNLLSAEFLEIIKMHLRPGGVYFYNTTDSPDANYTGLVSFSHAFRVSNFLALSDAPIDPDAFAWRAKVLGMRIDDRAAVPNDDSVAVARLNRLTELMNIPGQDAMAVFEREASLRARLRDAQVVTDNNMRVEWRELLVHQWLP